MARTINSPGVQITEKDLSLRIQAPAGTQVFVPGFAAQGPTSEPLMITSISEFESIYGIPTTPAERYFYYSCKEVLNSPAVLNTIRLPYGDGSGNAYSNAYSGLFYPSVTANHGNDPSWDIGAPIHVSLTQSQYDRITQGNFDWVDPSNATSELSTTTYVLSTITTTPAGSAAGYAFALAHDHDGADVTTSILSGINGLSASFSFSVSALETKIIADSSNIFNETNGEISIAAGLFILNDLQTVINEGSEGYYVGFADNSSVMESSEDFNSIKFLNTLHTTSSATQGTSFLTLSTTRLDFALSATKWNADKGVASISESLEKVGFTNFETKSYQDYLSLGVYKIRKSTADASKLTLGTTEKFLGSVDFNRKQVSQTGGILQNAYIEDLINNGSSTIKMHINPSVAKSSWGSGTPTQRVTVLEEAKGLFPIGVYTSNSVDAEKTKQIGLVPLKLEKALRTIENTENVTVDVLVDAGLSTIYSVTDYAAASAFNDETFVSDVGSTKEAWRAVVNELINFSENTRKDCFTIIDPPRSVFVTGRDTKVLSIEGNSFTANVYAPLKDCVDSIETNYAAIYANWVKQVDIFTGKRIWLPFSGYAAAVFGRNDAVAATWAAPAGFNRGGFNNAIDIALNPNQKQRDRLYEIATNPVVFFNGDGFTVFGQKTLQNKPTAFDRINVRRLFLTLERAVSRTVKYFVFEPNTVFTRKRLISTVSPVFDLASKTDGLYDYLIVCDERNNTPSTIDDNELIVDIYIKPVRTAEFILVNFIATRTNQNFLELI